MTSPEIKQHKAFQFISSLSNKQRHSILRGPQRSLIEKEFNCTVEEVPFTKLSELSNQDAYLSVTDSDRDICYIAVFTPNP